MLKDLLRFNKSASEFSSGNS